MVKGKIIKVSGPLVVAEELPGVKMYEVMRVGTPGLRWDSEASGQDKREGWKLYYQRNPHPWN